MDTVEQEEVVVTLVAEVEVEDMAEEEVLQLHQISLFTFDDMHINQ